MAQAGCNLPKAQSAKTGIPEPCGFKGNRLVPVLLVADASGAALGAALGLVVVIVDVIDFSTSMESALDAGARAVFGAAPMGNGLLVKTDPAMIGRAAGKLAAAAGTEVVVVAEPRWGSDLERRESAALVLAGIREGGGSLAAVLPNIGRQLPELAELRQRVVVGVSASGGAAYDAAFCRGAEVLTGTIAPTWSQKGRQPARRAARRALDVARRTESSGIAVVAASANAWEDVLAARYIAECLQEEA